MTALKHRNSTSGSNHAGELGPLPRCASAVKSLPTLSPWYLEVAVLSIWNLKHHVTALCTMISCTFVDESPSPWKYKRRVSSFGVIPYFLAAQRISWITDHHFAINAAEFAVLSESATGNRYCQLSARAAPSWPLHAGRPDQQRKLAGPSVAGYPTAQLIMTTSSLLHMFILQLRG